MPMSFGDYIPIGGGAPKAPPRVPPTTPTAPTGTTAPTTGLIPHSEWYYERDIGGVLGWTMEEFLAAIQRAQTTPSSLLTAEEKYAYGTSPTLEHARDQVARNKLIQESGGSWVNGVLTPPPGFGGSVTEYSNWLREQLGAAPTQPTAPEMKTPMGELNVMGEVEDVPFGQSISDAVTEAVSPLFGGGATTQPSPTMNPFQFGINPQTEQEVWEAMGGPGPVPGVTAQDPGGWPGVTTGGENMASPWATGSPEFMEELYGRGAGFGTALGTYGRDYLRPYEQYQKSTQPWLEMLYDVGGRLGTGGGMGQYSPGGMFSQWAPDYAQNPAGMYGLANQMMGGVMGMTPEGRAGADIGATGGDFSSLLAAALRTQLGKGTSGWLAGRLPGEQEKWQAQYPQQQGPTFMDYITQKYNLGQYFGGQ